MTASSFDLRCKSQKLAVRRTLYEESDHHFYREGTAFVATRNLSSALRGRP